MSNNRARLPAASEPMRAILHSFRGSFPAAITRAATRIRLWWRPPGFIPSLSLSPPLRWFYFRLLASLFARFPRPVWRVPAIALASLCAVVDTDAQRLSDPLLRALGLSPTRIARWRLHWMRCYRAEAALLLSLQPTRLTRSWAMAQVRCQGSLPPGGAILVAPHHPGSLFGMIRLSAMVERLGGFTIASRDPEQFAQLDLTLQIRDQLAREPVQRTFSGHRFVVGQTPTMRLGSIRQSLRLLQEGGYLVIQSDTFALGASLSPLLGRQFSIPQGAVWLATRSGKPIIPYIATPEGAHWRLWLGEPVPPTPAGLATALEMCIRHAPESWERAMAMAWMQSPHA